jgi:sugar phosphate isomerase/epimerase
MKKIGISIPWDYLSGSIETMEASLLEKTYGNAENFLKFIKALGVTYIELRHRKKDMPNVHMEFVFKLLADFNFNITIHGDDLSYNNWTINDVFPWIEAFKNVNSLISDQLMVTLHPYKGQASKSEYQVKTIEFIQRLADEIKNYYLPFSLALENQRNKGFVDPGTSFFEVEEMWREINRSNVGICWDMGHCYANYQLDNSTYPVYPHNKFTSATTHTHIHDLGPDGRTHWIFKENRVPLKDYIGQLKTAGYKGVYNLELSFDRFAGVKNQTDIVKDTIIKLREMI